MTKFFSVFEQAPAPLSPASCHPKKRKTTEIECWFCWRFSFYCGSWLGGGAEEGSFVLSSIPCLDSRSAAWQKDAVGQPLYRGQAPGQRYQEKPSAQYHIFRRILTACSLLINYMYSGGYLKTTSPGGIKFIFRGEGGREGNGHICADFISVCVLISDATFNAY